MRRDVVLDHCGEQRSADRAERSAEHYDSVLPTIKDTVLTTAILEAGRRSLDTKSTISITLKDGQYSLQ